MINIHRYKQGKGMGKIILAGMLDAVVVISGVYNKFKSGTKMSIGVPEFRVLLSFEEWQELKKLGDEWWTSPVDVNLERYSDPKHNPARTFVQKSFYS